MRSRSRTINALLAVSFAALTCAATPGQEPAPAAHPAPAPHPSPAARPPAGPAARPPRAGQPSDRQQMPGADKQQQRAEKDQQKQEKNQQKADKQQQKMEKDQQKRDKDQSKHDRGDQKQMARNGNQPRGGNNRIPQDKFRSHFGQPHRFAARRVITTTRIIPNQTRFVYTGYTFMFLEPWPMGWGWDDDCYIDYVDDGYYMFDYMHPGVRIGLTFIG